ncbi:MAG: hypothetical protein OEZ68_10335 [Gammaproteobacteria bacterium]|nr:hypothetical protein [Gammaproteobacteria bacterium]MDH5801188.1 hypothetical protein [Gammaproteobacteria bacterium]
MAQTQLKDLNPGMVLAADAVLSNGRLLARRGAVLDAAAIKLFKTWGLLQADVVDSSYPSTQEPPTSASAQWKAELERLFQFTDRNHPLIAALFRARLEAGPRR